LIELIPVILCGGSGKRLWPLSKKSIPKQFVNIADEPSLLQKTASIFNSKYFDVIKIPEIIFIGNEEHRFILQNEINATQIKNYKIILEPTSKNTAPAATLAACYVKSNYNKKINLLFVPSDQIIENTRIFSNTIIRALKKMSFYDFILFGHQIVNPSSNYGYIINDNSKKNYPKNFKLFIEKPSRLFLKKIINSNTLLLNSGIYLTNSDTWLSSINKFAPSIIKYINTATKNLTRDLNFVRPDKNYFNKCKSVSIDYAVTEKIHNSKFKLCVFKFNFPFRDLGNWTSLSEYLKKDKLDNRFFGNFFGFNSWGNIVYSKNKLIVTSGINNKLIVEQDDAILIGDKNDQSFFHLLGKNKKLRQDFLFDNPNIVYRPWGYYQILNTDKNYIIKKIFVNPKSALSLQSHKYRSEHWVVIKGTASIRLCSKNFKLQEGQSTFIKENQKHRLTNNTNQALIIIEIQFGIILTEDDIIRYSDNYNRN
jgi:mannose-1-phosphate guanylyltransferase/mannose-6-phosphate isomerase